MELAPLNIKTGVSHWDAHKLASANPLPYDCQARFQNPAPMRAARHSIAHIYQRAKIVRAFLVKSFIAVKIPLYPNDGSFLRLYLDTPMLSELEWRFMICADVIHVLHNVSVSWGFLKEYFIYYLLRVSIERVPT